MSFGQKMSVRSRAPSSKKTGRLAVLFAAAIALGAPGSTLAAEFQLSSGRTLELPELSELQGDCARIRQTIDQIDATRYRSGARPKNPADRPLFEYENKLSAMIMYCAQTRSPTR